MPDAIVIELWCPDVNNKSCYALRLIELSDFGVNRFLGHKGVKDASDQFGVKLNVEVSIGSIALVQVS